MLKSLILKIFICPIALILSDWIFPGIDFANIGQAIFVGLILAIVGTIMEYMLLREGTLWVSTLADFVATLIIVYFVTNALAGAGVTFWGAFLATLLITATEVVNHLIRGGYTRKSKAF